MQYFDAHVHIRGARRHPAGLAAWLQHFGLGFFSCGLEPHAWNDDRALEALPAVRAGAGLHPWNVQTEYAGSRRCEEAEVQLMEQLCWETRHIGEIGLDFGRKTDEARKRTQLEYLERICTAADAAAHETGEARVLSLHSVRSASAVLEVLERSGALVSCRCIFHWFSGSTEELWRAVRAGCWFSMNSMGLATGKGREYAKLVPADRLLTETDRELELGREEDVAWLCRELERSVQLIAAARCAEPDEIRLLAASNASILFGL